jgi:hypothetical protein
MQALTSAASLATVLVSGWMCVMYFVLRHPGYQWRAAIAASICLGALTLIAGRPAPSLRLPVAVWGAALAAFGISVFASPGDEGWVLIAGSVFVVEGALAVAAAVRYGSKPRRPTASL